MTITVRRPTFDLTDLPRRWVGGSQLGTWFGNAGHVFIPLGEQFFVDAVKTFRDDVDASRRRDVASFIGQESVHSRVHQTAWEQLRSHGVPVERYAGLIEGLRQALDTRVPAKLQLAITAALEHYTAVYGLAFLEEDLDEVLGAEMAALLRWHGAEEIEHRSVAYDVLNDVDDSWSLRVAGMAAATVLLTVVPAVGVAIFASDDLRHGRIRLPRRPDLGLARMSGRFLATVTREAVRYLDPSFHPDAAPEPDAYRRWLSTPTHIDAGVRPHHP